MTTTDGLVSRSLDVPGARLHFEVRGTGPAIVVIGSPMAAAEFAPFARALALDRTVVTYDPRGYAGHARTQRIHCPPAPSSSAMGES